MQATPTGTLPLDSDLYNSLYRGFNFTNMPSWKALSAQQRADLVAFIKTFSARWVTEKPGDPIQVPTEPKLTVESIKHGGELFQKLECWKCHGPHGEGDGPSASTLTDSQDNPIRPTTFRQTTRASSAVAPTQDIYKIFMTGVDGTPMPSFADVIQPNDAGIWSISCVRCRFLRQARSTRF